MFLSFIQRLLAAFVIIIFCGGCGCLLSFIQRVAVFVLFGRDGYFLPFFLSGSDVLLQRGLWGELVSGSQRF